jgi:hypothetical protein
MERFQEAIRIFIIMHGSGGEIYSEIFDNYVILQILVFSVEVWKILASPEQIGHSLPVP